MVLYAWLLASQVAPPIEPLRLDHVRVAATRSNELASEVPIPLSVWTDSDLRGTPADTVADRFRGRPGYYVQRTGPGQGNVLIRGLKGSEILHVVDGFRLNNSFFRNAPNQYLALVDAHALSQIEAIRGPVSALHGSDAMGGLIYLHTAELAPGEASALGRINAGYDSSTLGRHLHLRAGARGPRLGALVWATAQSLGSAQLAGAARRDPLTAYDAGGGGARVAWALDDARQLKLNLQQYEQPSTPRYDALVPGFAAQPESSEFVYGPQQRRFAQIVYSDQAGLGVFDRWQLQMGQQRLRDDRISRDLNAPTRQFEQNQSVLDGFSATFEVDRDRWRAVVGVDRYHDEVSSARQRQALADGSQQLIAARFPDGSTQDQTGIFGSVDALLNEHLDTMLSLRLTRSEVDLAATTVAPGVRLDDSGAAAHLSIGWQLAPTQRLMFNLGQGYRAPNIFDLGTLGDRPGNRFNAPNPDLAAERLLSADIGWRHDGERLTVEAFVYASRFRDKIEGVATGETTASGRQIVQNRNLGRVDYRGAELGLRYRLDTWAFQASSTATWGANRATDGSTEPADRVPPVFGRLGVERTIEGGWDAELYLDYAQRQDRLSARDRSDARIDPEGSAGFTVLGGRIGRQFNDALRVDLTLINLTDQQWREHGSGIDGAGRGVAVELNYEFR